MTLDEKHEWCILYRQLVRGGGIPGPELDEAFMRYQAELYAAGVMLERR
jgi:hypothetical protein